MSSACWYDFTGPRRSDRSFTQRLNSACPKMEHSGTPNAILMVSEALPSIKTNVDANLRAQFLWFFFSELCMVGLNVTGTTVP